MYARITYQNELTLYNISPETKKVFVDYIATHSPGGVFLALTDIEHFTLSQLIERCGGEAALQEYKNKDIEIMFNKSVLAADHTKDRFPASTRVLAIHEIAEKEHLPLEAALERAVQLGILAGNHERIVPPKIDDSVRLQSHVGIYTLEENHTFENKEQVDPYILRPQTIEPICIKCKVVLSKGQRRVYETKLQDRSLEQSLPTSIHQANGDAYVIHPIFFSEDLPGGIQACLTSASVGPDYARDVSSLK
ncbi:uncharacterized protein LOC135143503 [Zophobas morio]|uniref:uncharacterized protein LOC135143503 n=1 Tax=Zophobas morio TaxID=2755281 RepID=UPI00308377B0